MAERAGSPLWTAPRGCICALTALRSWSSLHLPDFFLIIKMGVFHGEVDGLMCPNLSCVVTISDKANSFSLGRGH